MATRSGRKYKQSELDMESLQEMMKALIDERRKREEEIAAERTHREEEMAAEQARCEEEIAAERARREEERVAREREVKQQMDTMQAQMERLMKVAEDSKPTAAKSAGELSVKLVPLSTATRGAGQTNRELAVRLMDIQKKWLKDAKTVEEMRDRAVSKYTACGTEALGN